MVYRSCRIIPSKLKDIVQELDGNSWVRGSLPFGCQLCMKGMKVVYFMGGDCNSPSHCKWYCPLSENRRRPDAHYADELPVDDPSDLDQILDTLEAEIDAIDAQGMSITGGDPLSSSRKVDLVIAILHGIKAKYGSDFHIHLYTSGKHFDPVIADRLDEAGLDSLRFHPDREDFHKIEFAIDHTYTVGAEVPVIPTEDHYKYLKALAEYLQAIGADYLNLNEFEICAPNQQELLSRGFTLEPGSLATVAGSRQFAERLAENFPLHNTLTLHFCSVAVKDRVQIQARYLRRAENIRYFYEEISEDGCLLFMQIQGPLQEIKALAKYLHEEAGVPHKALHLNPTKGTLDLPSFLAEEDGFIDLVSEYRVKCGIYEILPFREPDLAEVREYTPIVNNLPRKK